MLRLGVLIALLATVPAFSADFTVIRREIAVARPPDVVWAKVGDFCAGIAAFLKVDCAYVKGEGDVGTIRRLTGGTDEVMVARTAHSYAYQQTAGSLAALDYHGALSVEPDGAGAKVVYTLIYDAGALPPERRAATESVLTGVFQHAVETIKSLSESP
jgi:hypothetical protein